MKKIIFCSILILFPVVCFADFDIGKWKFYKDVDSKTEGLVRFAIDDEIFANTRKDLQDLRIIDNSGREIPFKLNLGVSGGELKTYKPRMINNSYVPGKFSTVILDFANSGIAVNRLKINTSSENFQRNVKVYGSDNLENWNILQENIYIYDYSDSRGNFKSQNTEIEFPGSIYKYLKIEISDDNNNPVKIDSVTGFQHTKGKIKELQRFPKFSLSKKSKATEISIDLEASGIPINKMELNIGDKNFNREAMIYSSYNKSDWRNLGQSYIFRYNTPKFSGENTTLYFNETNDKYLKIIIENKDNEPLEIKGIKTFSTYREIIFQSEKDKKYRVYYCNENGLFPEYDLEKYFQYLDLNKAADIKLSIQQNNNKLIVNANKKVAPKSEKIPYLMSVSLIASALLLLFLIYKFFQKK